MVISPTNLTSSTRPFLARRRVWAGHKTSYLCTELCCYVSNYIRILSPYTPASLPPHHFTIHSSHPHLPINLNLHSTHTSTDLSQSSQMSPPSTTWVPSTSTQAGPKKPWKCLNKPWNWNQVGWRPSAAMYVSRFCIFSQPILPPASPVFKKSFIGFHPGSDIGATWERGESH